MEIVPVCKVNSDPGPVRGVCLFFISAGFRLGRRQRDAPVSASARRTSRNSWHCLRQKLSWFSEADMFEKLSYDLLIRGQKRWPIIFQVAFVLDSDG